MFINMEIVTVGPLYVYAYTCHGMEAIAAQIFNINPLKIKQKKCKPT